MKEVYRKIWKLARPYHEKGRPMDIDHIEWMMEDASYVCKRENLDDSLLVPLVILHDVGYGVGDEVYFEKEKKRQPMIEGTKISKEILESINYSPEKIEKICSWISIHDNWIFGENEIYKKDIILGTFTDLDYSWMATPKGFPAIKKILKLSDKEMIEFLEKNDKPILRPFITKTTKNLYENYLNDRKKEVSGKVN